MSQLPTSEPYKAVKPRILKMYPPNIGRITRVFPMARKRGVIFTYGDTIYNPSGNKLAPELIAHEMVHIEQQHGANPEVWWALYLKDEAFRLGMEIPAHKAEMDYLRVYKRPYGHVLARLISSLYGNMLPKDMTASDVEYLLDHYSYRGLLNVTGENVANLGSGDGDHKPATPNQADDHGDNFTPVVKDA